MCAFSQVAELRDAKFLEVPKALREFGDRYGINKILLVDAPNLRRSLRSENNILISARCTYWTATIEPPYRSETYYETVVLRFLHEIGHHFHKHSSNAQLDAQGNVVTQVDGDIFQKTLGGIEGEAWIFAFEVRKNEPAVYQQLINAVKNLLSAHKFENMDWKETAEEQFKKIHGLSHKQAQFRLPDWVKSRYAKYLS